jgi:predicted  nucleic acid-binding Zn-ribbon protein
MRNVSRYGGTPEMYNEYARMNADLQRLIDLQRLDSAAQEAQRRLAEAPDREKALEARLEAARQHVASAKARLTDSQNARRAIEKEVAVHQGRLSKFREQAMAVKTNQEYHAIQHEITFAQTEIKKLEDAELERMLEGDDLAATVKRTDAELAAEQKAIEADRRAMAAEAATLQAALDRLSTERAGVIAAIDKQVLSMFEQIARKRHGVAVAEAREGICTICHVRLRPQVFNNVRRNDAIVQCDSCNRILFFVPAAAPAPDDTKQPAQ